MIAVPSRRPLRIGRLVALLLALAMVAPAARAADSAETPPARPTFKEALRTFVRDGRYLVTFPARAGRKGAWGTAGVVALTAITMRRDQAIRANVIESDRPGASRIATKLEPLGRIEVEAASLGVLYLAGRGARSGRVASSAATALEACLWSGLLTGVTKGAFGRERPERGSEGEFFAGDSIFPSGHTARSFAIAAVFADRGGRRAAFVAYPLAALVGLSTVQEDLHWGSDVIAGAGLGLAIGKGIAARHPRTRAGAEPAASVGVVPSPGGAALRISF